MSGTKDTDVADETPPTDPSPDQSSDVEDDEVINKNNSRSQ